VKDLRGESLRVATDKPDGVFLANMNQQAISARRLRALGYNGPFLSALLDQMRIDEGAGALEGTISAQSPEAQSSFVSAYVDRFGSKPSGSADTAHDALIALSAAIDAAATLEPVPVRNALLQVDLEG